MQNKREGSSLNEDLAARVKRPKVVQIAPSSLAKPGTYEPMQGDPTEDDRPREDDNIPPVSLLYEGFGQFLDIFAGDSNVESCNDVKASELEFAVDEFAESMCGFFDTEDDKKVTGLKRLNKIFAARKDGFRPKLAAAHIGAVTTDGQYTGDHGVVTMLCEFKNRSTGNRAIPEVELVGWFARSFARGVDNHPRKLSGWRVPALGVTIVGMG